MLTILNIFLMLIVIAFHFYHWRCCTATEPRLDALVDVREKMRFTESPKYPVGLTLYKLGDKNTGAFDNWNKDSTVLGELCESMTHAIRYVLSHPKEKARRAHVVCTCEDFIARYRDALIRSPNDRIPWGNNWYQFSISSTCMLAHYLIIGKYTSMSDDAADLILRIIERPCRSLGYDRRNVNALYLLGPWLIAKIHRCENLESLKHHEDVRFCLSLADMRVTYERNANGLHLDNSYMAHEGVLAFQYLFNIDSHITSYWRPLFADRFGRLCEIIDTVKSCVAHPSIDRTLIGINGRKNDSSTFTYKHDKLGAYAMPLSGFVRFFTNEHAFFLRLQKQGLAFYETDQTINDMAQYWVQQRAIFTKLSPKKPRFPDIGIVCATNVDAPLTIRSKTNTTQALFPKEARSFVFHHSNKTIAWQYYRIDEFGDYTMKECVTIDETRSIVRVEACVSNTGMKEVRYYGASNDETSLNEPRIHSYAIEPRSTCTIVTIFRLNDNKVSSRVLTTDTDSTNMPPEKPFADNDSYIVKIRNGYAILSYHGKSILACPFTDVDKTEARVLFVKDDSEDEYEFFEHNAATNQYEFVGREPVSAQKRS